MIARYFLTTARIYIELHNAYKYQIKIMLDDYQGITDLTPLEFSRDYNTRLTRTKTTPWRSCHLVFYIYGVAGFCDCFYRLRCVTRPKFRTLQRVPINTE